MTWTFGRPDELVVVGSGPILELPRRQARLLFHLGDEFSGSSLGLTYLGLAVIATL